MLDEILLDAYALPDDHDVYKCFPGEGYKFYDVVEAQNVVFLDVGGLDAFLRIQPCGIMRRCSKLLRWITFPAHQRGSAELGAGGSGRVAFPSAMLIS